MKKNKIKFLLAILFSLIFFKTLTAEIIILSGCDSPKDGFLKNEYILDLNKSLMTRNYVYNQKTFERYKVTDLSIKKENSLTRFIYTDDEKILTDKIGYPQFYTQLLFEKNNPIIKIKTVINNEEGISIISNCKKIENFQKES
jgi:general stress protein CsbA